MSRTFTALFLILGLSACDGTNPFQQLAELDPVIEQDPDNPINDAGIPLSLGENLQTVSYNPGATPGTGTLSVDMLALDRTDSEIPLQSYTPNPTLTSLAPGYEVFSYQDDGLDRMFVAIVARSEDGSVEGAVVMDGGQFTKFFGGTYYSSDGTYTPGTGQNDTGLVSYAGNYAGLANLPADGTQLISIPAGTDPAITPDQPVQISGDIFFNVDFGDNTINGAIYNRAFENLDPVIAAVIGTDLPDVFLIPADITTAGTFFGDAENPAQEGIGVYGGTFGGIEAPGLAGSIHLDGDWLPTVENEEEFGVFVLTQCGQSGEDPLCDAIPVNP